MTEPTKTPVADLLDDDLDRLVAQVEGVAYSQAYAPTRNALLALPLIEKHKVSVCAAPNDWAAFMHACVLKVEQLPPKTLSGPTPLVAAMRAIVAQHLGDEVVLP